MTPNFKLMLCALTVTALLLLVSGCSSVSPASLPPVAEQQAQLPPLPAQALPPARPPICSPTCHAGLERLRTELLNSLSKVMEPLSSAPQTMK